MSSAFKDMCLELADEPEKLAKFIKLYYDGDDDKSYLVECHFCDKKLEKPNLD